MDNKEHKLPHIHIEYAEAQAVISISDCKILAGDFPKSKLKSVNAWMEIHKDELMANWKLAVSGEPVLK
jgi:Domain of unknown function (DUF4160)